MVPGNSYEDVRFFLTNAPELPIEGATLVAGPARNAASRTISRASIHSRSASTVSGDSGVTLRDQEAEDAAGTEHPADLRERGIHVGTRMVWDPGIQRVGRLLVGKAMDDRLGVAVLVELSRRLAERKPRFDITLALTVQEEIGMVGASSLARDGRTYDVGFIIDNGLAGDIPTVSEEHMPVRLGGGPALVHRDSSVHYSRRLIGELRAVAEKHEIPVQDVVLYHYSSDGAHLVRQGMETLLVAPPIRYSHSPFEAVDPRDVESAVRLFEAYLTESDPE